MSYSIALTLAALAAALILSPLATAEPEAGENVCVTQVGDHTICASGTVGAGPRACAGISGPLARGGACVQSTIYSPCSADALTTPVACVYSYTP